MLGLSTDLASYERTNRNSSCAVFPVDVLVLLVEPEKATRYLHGIDTIFLASKSEPAPFVNVPEGLEREEDEEGGKQELIDSATIGRVIDDCSFVQNAVEADKKD